MPPCAWCLKLISMRDLLAGDVRKASMVLLGIVVFVLLTACANIAHLLLSRITERHRELVLRAALGASRPGRGVLGLAPGRKRAAGLARRAGVHDSGLARAGLRRGRGGPHRAGLRRDSRQPDWPHATGRGSAPQPAGDARYRSSPHARGADCDASRLHPDPGGRFPEHGPQFSKDPERGARIPHGSRSHHECGAFRDSSPTRAGTILPGALARLRAVPGVESAGAVEFLPLATNSFMGLDFELDGSRRPQMGLIVTATPDYLRTMSTELFRGRDFTPAEARGFQPVAIVNEAFARQFGNGIELVGKRMTSLLRKEPVTIVGVTHNVRYFGPTDSGTPQVFLDRKST